MFNRKEIGHSQRSPLCRQRLSKRSTSRTPCNDLRRTAGANEDSIGPSPVDTRRLPRAEDRTALMETLRTIDGRLDRLEHQVEGRGSHFNDPGVRHRHLVHKVANLEKGVAVRIAIALFPRRSVRESSAADFDISPTADSLPQQSLEAARAEVSFCPSPERSHRQPDNMPDTPVLIQRPHKAHVTNGGPNPGAILWPCSWGGRAANPPA